MAEDLKKEGRREKAGVGQSRRQNHSSWWRRSVPWAQRPWSCSVRDRKLICVICRDGRDHRGHEFKPVKEGQDDIKEDLASALFRLQEGVSELKKFLEIECSAAASTEQRSNSLKAQIKAQFEELREQMRLDMQLFDSVRWIINVLNVSRLPLLILTTWWCLTLPTVMWGECLFTEIHRISTYVVLHNDRWYVAWSERGNVVEECSSVSFQADDWVPYPVCKYVCL